MISLWAFIKGILIKNDTDQTKQMALEVDNTATTNTRTTLKSFQTANRTLSLPDRTDTLVGRDTSDTLTNKIIDGNSNSLSNLTHGDEVDNPSSNVHGVTGNVVGTSDAQTLTNKSIDADTNTITNIDDANIKALAGIDASKIADGSVSNLEFQTLDGVTSNIQTQIDNTNTAINNLTAADIDNVPSGNLSATNLQGAVNELQTDIDTRALDSDLTAHIADTSAHGVTGNVLGTTDTQTVTNKTIDANLNTISNLAHGAEVDNPSSGVHGVTGNVVGTTDTQDLSNKTFTDAITLQEQASTPTTPAAGDKKIYPKTDGKFYSLDDAGNEIEIGAGGGTAGINYVINSDFETGLDDTSTDGSGNVTIALETVNPVRGSQSATISVNTAANNTQYAELAMDPVDPIDYQSGRPILIRFDYYTSGNYQVDDIEVYLRRLDATAADIPLANSTGFIDPSTSKTTFLGYAYLDSDASNYALRFKSGGVAATVSVTIDNVKVGPDSFTAVDSEIVNSIFRQQNDGRAITAGENIPYTTASGEQGNGWTEGPDDSTDNNYTVQNEDSIIEINTSVFATTSATRYLSLYKNGSFYRYIGTGPNQIISGSYRSYEGEFVVGDKLSISSPGGFTLANGTSHWIKIKEYKKVTNVISSTDALMRSASLIVTGTPTSTINGSLNDIVFPNVQKDRLNIYDNTTGEITIPKDGIYIISVTNEQSATATATSNTYAIEIYNKTTTSTIVRSRENPYAGSGTVVMAPKATEIFEASKGDIIVVRSQNNATSPSYVSSYEGQRLALVSWNDLTSAGVYPDTKIYDVTSTEKTSAGFNEYLAMTNNSFDFKAGIRYRIDIHGDFRAVANDFRSTELVLATANGADTTTIPSLVSTSNILSGENLYRINPNGDAYNQINQQYGTTIVQFSSDTTVYLVPKLNWAAGATASDFRVKVRMTITTL